MITGIWQNTDGDLVAIQFDGNEIVTLDFTFNPPLQAPVVALGPEWTGLHHPAHSWCIPVEQA